MRFSLQLGVLLTLLILLTCVVSSSSSQLNNQIIIYYNGTVVATLNNVNQFKLIGSSYNDIRVTGASYTIVNGYMYFHNITGSIYVVYNTVLPKGVINVVENNSFNVIVLLPINATLNYISPQPSSFTVVNNLYNLTFKNVSQITLLYASSPSPQVTVSQQNNLVFPIIIALVIIDAVLLYFLVRLFRRRNVEIVTQGAEDEEVNLSNETLDERDTMILEAIKMGGNNLTEIMRLTGLPKSTIYRRIRKLVRLGYVEEIRERGKVRYSVKKEKN
ncbi:helix-turn-helix domain-containing protein [Sulfolobus acidocaldarius]|uniref:helix-turn-helix domain-containing protein n=1 Tax=Sulfolobus acidocaldarius TaxID=2285 RepID=UPI000B0E1405|nr:helix-turn-helix domain-containing protein [Sulfolobus acidocaldarius]